MAVPDSIIPLEPATAYLNLEKLEEVRRFRVFAQQAERFKKTEESAEKK